MQYHRPRTLPDSEESNSSRLYMCRGSPNPLKIKLYF